MSIDLDKMTLDELKAHEDAVKSALSRATIMATAEARAAEEAHKSEAAEALHAVCEKYGYTLEELRSTYFRKYVEPKNVAAAKAREKVEAEAYFSNMKYQDPKNPRDMWSGRGRKPKWVVHWLDRGKSLEDFRVKGELAWIDPLMLEHDKRSYFIDRRPPVDFNTTPKKGL